MVATGLNRGLPHLRLSREASYRNETDISDELIE